MPNVTGFSKSYKYYISDNDNERSDSPPVGENIYKNRTAINQSVRGRDMYGRERSIAYFRCYTVHVVKSFNYFTNHCTYINL